RQISGERTRLEENDGEEQQRGRRRDEYAQHPASASFTNQNYKNGETSAAKQRQLQKQATERVQNKYGTIRVIRKNVPLDARRAVAQFKQSSWQPSRCTEQISVLRPAIFG